MRERRAQRGRRPAGPHPPAEVRRPAGRSAGIFATAPVAPGARILPLEGRLEAEPGRYTLQVGGTEHLAPEAASRPVRHGLPPDAWRFLNHACRPNAEVNIAALEVRATRPIEAGDEITLDYDLTEWDLSSPFRCRCAAAACRGAVRGFRNLPEERRAELLPRAAAHVRELEEARGRGTPGGARRGGGAETAAGAG